MASCVAATEGYRSSKNFNAADAVNRFEMSRVIMPSNKGARIGARGVKCCVAKSYFN
jgi:hypothetical protein